LGLTVLAAGALALLFELYTAVVIGTFYANPKLFEDTVDYLLSLGFDFTGVAIV